MLAFLAHIYGFIIGLRNCFYDKGILRSYKTLPFVISVGNIEVGGTGKTPFTMLLAQELSANGHKVAIVTRGYRGRLKGTALIDPSLHTYEDVGDEALLMAKALRIPVIKSPDRVAGANFASKELGTSIIILDDGFQHRRICRDYNICLVSTDLSREALLPAGRLREPAASLARAHCVVHTKGQSGEIQADLVPDCLLNRFGDPVNTPIKGKVLAFCGIARPEPFFSQLAQKDVILETHAFGDHHHFSKRDLQMLKQRAHGKDLIITTEKDLVRIDSAIFGEKLHALRVKMRVSGIERIVREIEAHVHKCGIL